MLLVNDIGGIIMTLLTFGHVRDSVGSA